MVVNGLRVPRHARSLRGVGIWRSIRAAVHFRITGARVEWSGPLGELAAAASIV
jgi:hypothetical protein